MNNTRERYPILNVPFNGLSKEEALQALLELLETDGNHLVVTPNPEACMLAQRDKNFLDILQSANLVFPDGIGILLAAKYLKLPIPTRVTGCDITMSLLNAAKNHSCFLVGGKPGVAEKARSNLINQGINVLGAYSGYFDYKEQILILEEIRRLKPDILLVGMGMPKQEQWAFTHLRSLPCKVTLCVGGSIDIFAGNVKRAPEIMRRIGLEWLYRLISQPSRAKRMLDLPKFVLAVYKSSKHMFP